MVIKAPLSKEEIKHIRSIYNNGGMNITDLSKKYDRSRECIYQIINNEVYYDKSYTRTKLSRSLINDEKSVKSEHIKEIRQIYLAMKGLKLTLDLCKKYNYTISILKKIIRNEIFKDSNYIFDKNAAQKNLSFSDVKEIRRLYNNENMSLVSIAKQYDAHWANILKIVNNQIYYDPDYRRIRFPQLTPSKALEIRTFAKSNPNVSIEELMVKFNTKYWTVNNILKDKIFTAPCCYP